MIKCQVPRYGTEGEFTASVIGCTYYVVVAIIWSVIWYLGLDPIKWVLAWILNEDGFRDLKVISRIAEGCRTSVDEAVSRLHCVSTAVI